MNACWLLLMILMLSTACVPQTQRPPARLERVVPVVAVPPPFDLEAVDR